MDVKRKKRLDAKDKIIAEQANRIAELEGLLKDALDTIATLKKNSQTSSKSPSSDIVKPPKPPLQDENGNEVKRKIGGQPGHKQTLRTPIAPELVDDICILNLTICPDCGQKVTLENTEPKITQQIELVEKPVFITEYQQFRYWCKHCNRFHYAKLPPEIEKAGLFGPNMKTLTAYLKGRCHASYTTLADYFRDVMHVDISRGFLAKQIKQATESLKTPYSELAELLQTEEHLHIDETSFKKNGKLQWVWCFVAELYSVFKIAPSRSTQVLFDTLGLDFSGTITCDFYAAYRKYGRETVEAILQFCWAHLIRELKFLATLADTKTYGKRLLKYVKAMFETIHRRGELTEIGFKRLMNKHQQAIRKTVQRNVPDHKKAEAIRNRFEQFGDEYFLFINDTKVSPTNNAAEREIRTVVLDRMVTQGTRSEGGNHWHECFWTVLATCRKQGRDVMEFLQLAMECYLKGLPPPSLVPES